VHDRPQLPSHLVLWVVHVQNLQKYIQKFGCYLRRS
jgi:hypothetical protein